MKRVARCFNQMLRDSSLKSQAQVKSLAARASWKVQEKVKRIVSRACWKFKGKVKSVAPGVLAKSQESEEPTIKSMLESPRESSERRIESRACWKFQGRAKSVASKAFLVVPRER